MKGIFVLVPFGWLVGFVSEGCVLNLDFKDNS